MRDAREAPDVVKIRIGDQRGFTTMVRRVVVGREWIERLADIQAGKLRSRLAAPVCGQQQTEIISALEIESAAMLRTVHPVDQIGMRRSIWIRHRELFAVVSNRRVPEKLRPQWPTDRSRPRRELTLARVGIRARFLLNHLAAAGPFDVNEV